LWPGFSILKVGDFWGTESLRTEHIFLNLRAIGKFGEVEIQNKLSAVIDRRYKGTGSMKKLNVGISLFATESSNIWSNGINQNIALLGILLLKSPAIDKVWFLNGGDVERLPSGMQFEGIDVPFVRPHDVTHEIDVLIEMGAIMPIEWMLRIHARGAKIVCFGVGHNFNAAAETACFPNKTAGIHLSDPALRVETWGLPQHAKSCSPMMRTITRKPVVDMPHLWSPHFLDKTIKQKEAEGKTFGFKPSARARQRNPWKTAIFEPNIAVGKNCFIPMMVCEQAYRQNDRCIDHMMVMDAVKMKDHQTFLRFALNLDLNKHHKASYEPRLQFATAMVDHKRDAVVTHHWEWGQNYLYYDALYGGYPLIHNSEFLLEAGVGMYYPGFSALEGGRVLAEAWAQPPEFWQDYQRKAKEYLATLHPEHPENIRIFTERLQHVYNS
jgi:hypothetical protein